MNEIAEYLSDLNITDEVDEDTQTTYKEILYEAAQDLKDCIQNRLDQYLVSYYPSVYHRTGNLSEALYVDDFADIQIIGDTLSIQLKFDENLSYHNSLFDGYSDGYTPWLINYGWQVKKNVWFKNIEHFGFMQPTYFIENGIDDFNKENKWGVKVELQKI